MEYAHAAPVRTRTHNAASTASTTLLGTFMFADCMGFVTIPRRRGLELRKHPPLPPQLLIRCPGLGRGVVRLYVRQDGVVKPAVALTPPLDERYAIVGQRHQHAVRQDLAGAVLHRGGCTASGRASRRGRARTSPCPRSPASVAIGTQIVPATSAFGTVRHRDASRRRTASRRA